MNLGPSVFRAFAPLVAAAFLLGGGSGCSKEEAPAPASAPVVRKIVPQPAAAPPPIAAPEEKKPEEKRPDVASKPAYEPEGKRDPFVSFAKGDAQKNLDEQNSLPPLQRYELGELKMVGVIWSKAGSSALVEDAEGKGYTVLVGNRIGRSGGVVTRITDKEITVREEFPGAGGKTVARDSVLQLTTAGGNQ
ncbi:MAG: pilus assembly protein PilP [Deltaproteobacteria bacterium]|nr:pilus assembly protein PilP [Deltaproteobacteria bacterium]